MRSRYAAFAIPNGDYLWKLHYLTKGNFTIKQNWKTGEKKTLGRN